MKLVLNIYTDDSLVEVAKVVEADKLRVPYRVVTYVAESLESVDVENEVQLFNFITSNVDKLDKIIKATFKITDTELECIDVMELGDVAVEIYKWAMEKIKGLKNKADNSKNSAATV
jgi:hypothetical protein